MNENDKKAYSALLELERELSKYNLKLETFDGDSLFDLLHTLHSTWKQLKDVGRTLEGAHQELTRLKKLARKLNAQKRQEGDAQLLVTAAKRMAGRT